MHCLKTSSFLMVMKTDLDSNYRDLVNPERAGRTFMHRRRFFERICIIYESLSHLNPESHAHSGVNKRKGRVSTSGRILHNNMQYPPFTLCTVHC